LSLSLRCPNSGNSKKKETLQLNYSMSKIPLETILTYWQQMKLTFDKEAIYVSLKNCHTSQRLLMHYLLSAEKNILNEDEIQLLYYPGSFIVDVMIKENPNLDEVKIELWEKVRESNMDMMEFLSTEEGEGMIRSLHDVIDANPQSELLRFVTDALMHDKTSQNIREENIWRLLTHLKIVLDCLEKVGEKKDNRAASRF